jgi:hypothetical protein
MTVPSLPKGLYFYLGQEVANLFDPVVPLPFAIRPIPALLAGKYIPLRSHPGMPTISEPVT